MIPNSPLVQYVLIGAATLLSVRAICWLSAGILRCKKRCEMNAIRKSYQNYLRSQKQKFVEYLSNHPMDENLIEEITTMSVPELIKELQSKKRDYKQVLLAFQHKAFRVNEELNCIVEFLFPDFSDVNLNGPLAGLPVSIKESFYIKDCISCAGMVLCIAWNKPQQDCVLVQVIKQLGGVPFCRTNVPQAAMSLQSENPVYGATLNPYDKTRSPGGSSSGEGALIACNGSPVGFGTDIGGSIRIPAAWCGIVGFKPSCRRLSPRGLLPIADQLLVPESVGPLARDVETVNELMRLITSSAVHRALDSDIPYLPWRDECFGTERRSLRIGVFTFNEFFHSATACVNVVNEVREALIKKGHECVPFQLPANGKVFFDYYLKFILCDGGQDFLDFLEVDEVDDSLKDFYMAGSLPTWSLHLIRTLYEYILRNEDSLMILRHVKGYKSVSAMWRDRSDFVLLRQQVELYWKEMNLDAVLCPASGCLPAFIKGSKPYLGAVSYTSFFNLMNYPAGIVPVRHVKPSDLVNISAQRKSEWHNSAFEFEKNSVGLPLGVQVATLPYEEEECLYVMKVIQDVMRAE